MTEEEKIAVNCSFERHRKAMISAGRDNKKNIEAAGNSLYILQRTHNDNMINRWISTPIAVSESVEDLIAFCRKQYGEGFVFDEQLRSNSYETEMGEAYFRIDRVAKV